MNSNHSSILFVQILHVHAEDGDKGNPREIRYGLVSEGNPFTSFFNINDTTGKFCSMFCKIFYIFNTSRNTIQRRLVY